MSTLTARISSKNQVVLPQEVCVQLGVGPGDTLAFQIDADGVRIVMATSGDPFAVFDDWAGEADEDAYRTL